MRKKANRSLNIINSLTIYTCNVLSPTTVYLYIIQVCIYSFIYVICCWRLTMVGLEIVIVNLFREGNLESCRSSRRVGEAPSAGQNCFPRGVTGAKGPYDGNRQSDTEQDVFTHF